MKRTKDNNKEWYMSHIARLIITIWKVLFIAVILKNWDFCEVGLIFNFKFLLDFKMA